MNKRETFRGETKQGQPFKITSNQERSKHTKKTRTLIVSACISCMFLTFTDPPKEPDVFQEVDTHSTVRVVELLEKIPRKKYPALTEDEENISLSLQTVCLALFDAVLVHTVNDVADQRGIDWHALKNGLTEVLVKGKVKRTIDIIANRSEDILFLQEVAGTFPKEARRSLAWTLCPDHLSARPLFPVYCLCPDWYNTNTSANMKTNDDDRDRYKDQNQDQWPAPRAEIGTPCSWFPSSVSCTPVSQFPDKRRRVFELRYYVHADGTRGHPVL